MIINSFPSLFRSDRESVASAPRASWVLPAHYPALDGLRGVAILFVLLHMLNVLAPQPGILVDLFTRLSDVGWIGVQLFFVLSGFLITGILLDTQQAKNYYSGFYARRTLRIFPLYFGVLALAFFVLPALNLAPAGLIEDQHNQLWLWSYLSNWSGHFGIENHTFPHFWSLGLEEQFYLVWPLLVRSRSPVRVLRFCLGVAVFSLLLRSLLAWQQVAYVVIYQDSFCRMDALALGGGAAAALRIPALQHWLMDKRQSLLAASIALALIGYVSLRGFAVTTLAGQTLGYTVVSVMFVMLLVAAVGADISGAGGWAGVLRFGPLRALGKYSYAIYIFHKPLHDYVGKPLALKFNLPQSLPLNLLYIICAMAVIFSSAFVSWHLYEKHFLKLKRYFSAQN